MVLEVNNPVRVKGKDDDVYARGWIKAITPTGYVIRYEDGTIGTDVPKAWIIGPQSYTLKCPNPSCHNKLKSNYHYLVVPHNEASIFCCYECIVKIKKLSGYHKTHKKGSDEVYTWMNQNRNV